MGAVLLSVSIWGLRGRGWSRGWGPVRARSQYPVRLDNPHVRQLMQDAVFNTA